MEPKTTSRAGGTVTDAASTSTDATEEPVASPPLVVRGTGPTRRVIDVPEFRPFVLASRYRAGDILSVNVRGEGLERQQGHEGRFLFDGLRTSETATPGIAQGRYELVVRGTEGRWMLVLAGPNPEAPTTRLPETLRGSGDLVWKVRLDQATALEWEMQTTGGFLSASLLGYGAAEGAEQFLGIVQGGLLFEPGDQGLRTEDALPAGDYLLVVDADAEWVVVFTRFD